MTRPAAHSPSPDGSGKSALRAFRRRGGVERAPNPGQRAGADQRMDGMFAYGTTERAADAETLPLEVRWPAFAELLARGRARGRVTRDEFEVALPPGQVSQEDIDEGSAVLEELSIDVVEAERDQTTDDEVPNAAASVARVEEEDDTGPTTVDTALLGRTDDPVR